MSDKQHARGEMMNQAREVDSLRSNVQASKVTIDSLNRQLALLERNNDYLFKETSEWRNRYCESRLQCAEVREELEKSEKILCKVRKNYLDLLAKSGVFEEKIRKKDEVIQVCCWLFHLIFLICGKKILF